MYKEGFPSKLKNAREKAEYTQREVEEETGIKQTLISRYENGKLEPDIETTGILANLYKVSVDWLYGTTGGKKD